MSERVEAILPGAEWRSTLDDRSMPRERGRRAVVHRHELERRGVAASMVGRALVKQRRHADRDLIEHSIPALEHGEPTAQVDAARRRLAAA